MKTEIKVIRTCQETGKKSEVTLTYALEKLKGYWIDIETPLLQGYALWTPFATYQIKQPK